MSDSEQYPINVIPNTPPLSLETIDYSSSSTVWSADVGDSFRQQHITPVEGFVSNTRYNGHGLTLSTHITLPYLTTSTGQSPVSPLSSHSSAASMSPLLQLFDDFSVDGHSPSTLDSFLGDELPLLGAPDVFSEYSVSEETTHKGLLFGNAEDYDKLDPLFPDILSSLGVQDEPPQTFGDSPYRGSSQLSKAKEVITNSTGPACQGSPYCGPVFVEDDDYLTGSECYTHGSLTFAATQAPSLRLPIPFDASANSSPSSGTFLSPADCVWAGPSDPIQRRHSHSDGSDANRNQVIRRTRSSTTVRHRSPYSRHRELEPNNQTNDYLTVPSVTDTYSADHSWRNDINTNNSRSLSQDVTSVTSESDNGLEGTSMMGYRTMRRDIIASDAVLRASEKRRTKSPNFGCPRCGQLLTSKDNLNNHLDAHDGIRRHQCDFCTERFRTRSVLKRHQKSVKCAGSRSLGKKS